MSIGVGGGDGKKANVPRNLCKCKILYSNIKYEYKIHNIHLYNTCMPKLISCSRTTRAYEGWEELLRGHLPSPFYLPWEAIVRPFLITSDEVRGFLPCPPQTRAAEYKTAWLQSRISFSGTGYPTTHTVSIKPLYFQGYPFWSVGQGSI